MTRQSGSTRCALLTSAAVAIMCTSSAGEEPAAELVSVQAIPIVRVRVVVRNPTPERVFVPYCGDLEGTERLCGLATHVEVYDSGRWRVAMSSRGGVLGGRPLERSRAIESGGEETFVFEFSRNVLEIKPGVTARLVIEAWRAREAIRANSPEMQLRTGSFKLPTGGT